jgi:elongator complex protein 1
MKNLKLVTRIAQELQLQLDGETLAVSAIDAERHRAFFVSSANFLYSVHLLASTQVRVLNPRIPSNLIATVGSR